MSVQITNALIGRRVKDQYDGEMGVVTGVGSDRHGAPCIHLNLDDSGGVEYNESELTSIEDLEYDHNVIDNDNRILILGLDGKEDKPKPDVKIAANGKRFIVMGEGGETFNPCDLTVANSDGQFAKVADAEAFAKMHADETLSPGDELYVYQLVRKVKVGKKPVRVTKIK